MNYYAYHFQTPNADIAEIIMANLAALPFDTFEEKETGLVAYIPEKNVDAEIDAEIANICKDYNATFQKEWIVAQNWNSLWESNFQPLVMDDFVGLRADFHAPATNVRFDLVINPKMAFGTGHHETTWSMLELMQNIDFTDKKVLDYGCGTGVLAIVASKMGATTIDAVDNELPAYNNTIENAIRNDVHNINAAYGTLDMFEKEQYDIILANINRNVLMDSMDTLRKMLKSKGILLLSGFMDVDETIMGEEAIKHGFQKTKTLQKGYWLAMHWQ